MAAIAIPRLGAFNDTATIRTITANHKLVVNAINVAYSDGNAWPADMTTVDDYLEGFTLKTGDDTTLVDEAGGEHTWVVATKTLTSTDGTLGLTDWTDITYTAN